MKKPSDAEHPPPAPPGDDALWNLLGKAQPPEASDFFSRNVMREIRLAKQAPQSCWQKLAQTLRRPQLAIGLAVVLVAFITILALPLPPHSDSKTPQLVNAPAGEETLPNYLDEELLLVAADEPDLFSDEEVLAMLF
jgi:hypothetical protein